jgi:hypothetical protein
MEITLKRAGSPIMSPFGRRTRPFEEPKTATEELHVPVGTSFPSLIKMYYGEQVVPKPFRANFGFLDRHNKERKYNPKKEDPLVFGGGSSPETFKQEGLAIIEETMKIWKSLNLPITHDKDRGIDVPDSEAIWEAINPSHPQHEYVKKHLADIQFIISNMDIMKKFCIVRGVIPGWWASSYKGKVSGNLPVFEKSIDAHVKAINILKRTPKFKSVYQATQKDLGDPLDTNPGWPLFNGSMDKSGNPVGRLETINLLKGIGTQGYDWKKVVAAANHAARYTPCKDLPFLVAPLSRLQPGYKWAHVFNPTSSGLTTAYDERGNNTTRIAWMASYIYNLYLSPLQGEWKALRKLMPGLYHDGSSKILRLDYLRRSKAYLTESDYSNYDRFIPVDIYMDFSRKYLKGMDNAQYWMDMLEHLHYGLPLVWPDYIPGSGGNGWAFNPGILGLLSGVKITSEEGTFINSIVNGQVFIEMGLGNENDLVEYLTQYKDAPVGSKPEYWWIQSDDTAFINKDLGTLYKQGNMFGELVGKAGMKFELEFGDRFLMRSSAQGRDLPVPARVFQNTLSNEKPADDQLKFLVGLAVRTDGMLGYKTYDPFNTGKIQSVSPAEAKITTRIVKGMRNVLEGASIKTPDALSFLMRLEEAGEKMVRRAEAGETRLTIDPSFTSGLDRFRSNSLQLLSVREQEELAKADISKATSLMYQLHKDKNIPSSAMTLDLLKKNMSGLDTILEKVENKENTFYQFAMKQLNIPLHL